PIFPASHGRAFKRNVVHCMRWDRHQNAPKSLFLWYRTAPTWQVIGIVTFCQLKRFLERTIEIGLHGLSLYLSPQKLCPKEFAEGRCILGEAACAPQFAGERTVRIVDELIH